MHGPPVLAPAPWPVPPQERAKTNGTSILAFMSSLSSFVCLLGVGGVLGIALGLIARKEIARSERPENGRGLANAAVVLGVLNVTLTVIGMAVGITYLARPRPFSRGSGKTATVPSWALPRPAPRAPPAMLMPPAARSSRESGTQITHVGSITLADISGDFEAALDEQRKAADASSQTLILWLVVPNCKPCDGVSAALSSSDAQKALSQVRFVRADRDEFQLELERLGIPTEKIPGFALLDARNRALDFIHGGEWDADIAANIAPVLGKFAHREYTHRRDPYHGPARDDETPL